MRIALVHSYYSSRVPSGENRVVDAQARALRDVGHEVQVVAQSTDRRLRRRTYPLEAAFTTATGLGPSPTAQLHEFEPELVHVHNLFPNFGRSWLRRWDGPLVATLHNYRPICPAATLFRDGGPCRTARICGIDVAGGAPRVLPRELAGHSAGGAGDPVRPRSRAAAGRCGHHAERRNEPGLRRARMRADKLVAVDNFAEDRPIPGPGGEYWMFAGRLEPEKGLHALLPQWPAGHRLLVAGDPGEGFAPPSHSDVTMLGHVQPDRLRSLMAGARGLVFPRCGWRAWP